MLVRFLIHSLTLDDNDDYDSAVTVKLRNPEDYKYFCSVYCVAKENQSADTRIAEPQTG